MKGDSAPQPQSQPTHQPQPQPTPPRSQPKSGFVSIVGRPSSGKSTLLNALCGYKVSIVSATPQTTRNKIRGIVSAAEGQIVFIDTPGYHCSDKKMNQRLNALTEEALSEVDAVLYVVDAAREPGEEEAAVGELIQKASLPVAVAVNKMDLLPNPKEIPAALRLLFPKAAVFPVSALKNEGLDSLLSGLFSLLPNGDPLYPEEWVTDQPPEFRIAEVIREKAINRLSHELPHSLYVEIADLEQNGDRLWIRAFIAVERRSQVGITVGKKGSMIESIRTAAKRELKILFPGRSIRLELQVKVREKWRQKEATLDELLR